MFHSYLMSYKKKKHLLSYIINLGHDKEVYSRHYGYDLYCNMYICVKNNFFLNPIFFFIKKRHRQINICLNHVCESPPSPSQVLHYILLILRDLHPPPPILSFFLYVQCRYLQDKYGCLLIKYILFLLNCHLLTLPGGHSWPPLPDGPRSDWT
jgi:hypothetical protein